MVRAKHKPFLSSARQYMLRPEWETAAAELQVRVRDVLPVNRPIRTLPQRDRPRREGSNGSLNLCVHIGGCPIRRQNLPAGSEVFPNIANGLDALPVIVRL